jgi:hypothetical protein
VKSVKNDWIHTKTMYDKLYWIHTGYKKLCMISCIEFIQGTKTMYDKLYWEHLF